MIIRSLWKWTEKKYIAVNKYSIIDAKQKLTLQWCWDNHDSKSINI